MNRNIFICWLEWVATRQQPETWVEPGFSDDSWERPVPVLRGLGTFQASRIAEVGNHIIPCETAADGAFSCPDPLLNRIWQLGVDTYMSCAEDALHEGKNQRMIQVANHWPNRMIGDEFLPYDGVKNGRLPEWLASGNPRTSGRYTFTTFNCFTKESPLLPSGLLGPVTLKSNQ